MAKKRQIIKKGLFLIIQNLMTNAENKLNISKTHVTKGFEIFSFLTK